MHRLYGIETEYGIVVGALSANDWIAESIAVVRSYAGKAATGWNYRGEDPRRDMRGFTVQRLSTNPDDAKFDGPGSPTFASRSEERSDRILVNGARLYNDHGHPEYATPECSNLRDLVAHDKAGEKILLAAAAVRSEQRGDSGTLYKNNTDYHGSSYGTHEAYLMRRDTPTEDVIQGLLPFFVSRQLYAGAGKCGIENERPNSAAPADVFQLSQRADYFSVEASVDTLHNRPIVNTRDEPHATPRQYRRLHVICGDANMSEYATALKVGATNLVLRLLEDGEKPTLKLTDPVHAAKQISRDVTLKVAVERAGGPPVTALEIQRMYLMEAERRFCGEDEETDWVLGEWKEVLSALETTPDSLADRLDWAAKYQLLNQFRVDEGLEWNSPHMQSLDLAYHDIDPKQGLFYGLVEAGQMRTLVSQARIDAATTCAPQDTRAYIRGLFVDRFASEIRSIGWNGIAFKFDGEDLLFDMNPLVESNVRLLNEEFAAAESLNDVVNIIQKSKNKH